MDSVVEDKVETGEARPAQEPGRRSFFRKAFLTAAGMAFYTAAGDSAEAQGPNGAPVPVHSGDINVIVTEGHVTTQDIRQALKQIVTMAGCTGCGMVGIDINFLRGEVINLGDGALLPAVQSILVTSE